MEHGIDLEVLEKSMEHINNPINLSVNLIQTLELQPILSEQPENMKKMFLLDTSSLNFGKVSAYILKCSLHK